MINPAKIKIVMSLLARTAAVLLLTSTATLAEQAASLSFKTTEVTPGIYMLSGEGGFTGGNVGLLIGEDGVAMIDNGVPSVLNILRAEVAKTTEQPIDYMINTHVHGDHIGNNQDFGLNGSRIISHKNLRASLKNNGVADGAGGTKPASKATLPAITFSDQMTLHINDDAATIKHFANAHTDGDAIVHFQNANVIHTGDIMFNGLFPFIDDGNGGSADGVIAALKSIHDMSDDQTKIIPGHGPLANKSDVAKTIAMLEDSLSMVSKLVAAGKTEEEILQLNPLNKYAEFNWSFITTEKMTQQMIKGSR